MRKSSNSLVLSADLHLFVSSARFKKKPMTVHIFDHTGGPTYGSLMRVLSKLKDSRSKTLIQTIRVIISVHHPRTVKNHEVMAPCFLSKLKKKRKLQNNNCVTDLNK